MTPHTNSKRKAVEIFDRLTTTPWTAFPVFILLVYVLFWCTFSLGRYPMEWIQALVDGAVALGMHILPDGWVRSLLLDGVVAGVGGVLVFLPNIVILYLLISVMESTGYMARVAAMLDFLMHGMGLHGRSFIPMIMGFGCNVPAIMATSGIKDRKSRLITALIIPFMSCSGRLPVYLLLVGAFFPENGPLVLLGVYALGVLLAIGAAKLLSWMLPGTSTHDHVEILPYRMPDWRYVLRNTWDQAKEYMKKLAGPILIFSVALWTLGYFPRAQEGSTPYQQKEQSFVGMLGKAMDPVMEPVGMNWKDAVSIVAGVGAKELIVSTLGVMYSGGDDASLQDSLAGSHTPAGALAFIVFVLLYFPCVGTFVALRHATGGWKWPAVSAVLNILLAWCMAWLVFHLFSMPLLF